MWGDWEEDEQTSNKTVEIFVLYDGDLLSGSQTDILKISLYPSVLSNCPPSGNWTPTSEVKVLLHLKGNLIPLTNGRAVTVTVCVCVCVCVCV